MSHETAADLIRDVGIYRLSGTDGCLCMHCAVRGIEVEVACRKSSGGLDNIIPDFYGIVIRVHSRMMDARKEDLLAVAKEVAEQLKDEGYDIAARFCDHQHDWKQLCTYCNKPREEASAYLCNACEKKQGVCVGHSVKDEHDFRELDFVVRAEDSP